MKFIFIIAILLLGVTSAKSQQYARLIRNHNLPIPTLDLASDKSISNIVHYGSFKTPLHTSAVRLSTRGENILLAYMPHNSKEVSLKLSKDGGQSWDSKFNNKILIGNPATHISLFTLRGKNILPKQYQKERKLSNIANRNNLIMFFEGYPIKSAISMDNGIQWHKTFNHLGQSDIKVTSMIRLDNGQYIALLNSGRNMLNGRHVIYKSYSSDGGLTWTYPEIAIKHNIYSIENARIAKVDFNGKQYIVALANDIERRIGVISVSQDDGDTWSYPSPLPSFIQGDHYNITTLDNKLYIVYRDTYGNFNNDINNPTCGDLMLWYGTINDLKHGGKNTYRVRLADLPDIKIQLQNEKNNKTSIETPTINLLANNKLSIIVYGMWNEKFPPSIKSFTLLTNRLNKFNNKNYELLKK